MSKTTSGARRRKLRVPAAALLLLLAATTDAAAHGSAPHPQAGGRQRGVTTLGVTTSYVRGRRIPDAELIDFASRHIHAHSIDYTVTTTYGLSRALTDVLVVSASLPYVYRDNLRAGHHAHAGGGGAVNTVEYHGDSGGWGDATVQGRYRFLRDEAAGSEASLIVGLKMPTGRTTLTSGGATMEAEHQPGSGSWDPHLGFATAHRTGALRVETEMLFTMATRGAQATDLGDSVAGSLSLTRAHGDFGYTLRTSGHWSDMTSTRGRADRNSGGGEIFIGPALRYAPDGAGWSVHAELALPVADNLRAGHAGSMFHGSLGVSRDF